MLMALRPSATWPSIHSRWISHAEGVATGFGAGGRGGGFCPTSVVSTDFSAQIPVATPGEFASRAMRRIVLRSTPSTRAISRWDLPPSSKVWIEIRKFGFKTFTPGPLFSQKRT